MHVLVNKKKIVFGHLTEEFVPNLLKIDIDVHYNYPNTPLENLLIQIRTFFFLKEMVDLKENLHFWKM